MSATLRIVRVNQLPPAVNRNTLYLVDTPDPVVFDIYLSSPDGTKIEHSFGATDVASVVATLKNVPNGIAGLDSGGLIPSELLPSFVDDVLEYPSFETLPVNGFPGKIYVTTADNRVWRWTGASYFEVSSLSGVAASAHKLETARTINGVAFDGTSNIVVNAVDLTPRIGSWEKAVPDGVATLGSDGNVPLNQLALVTKSAIGLGNVDNTADANKPVSAAQQTAITDAQNAAIAASTPSAHVGSSGTSHAQVTTTIDGFMSAADKVKLNAVTGTNTGDETAATVRTKLGIVTLSGSNTGDETAATIRSKLGITTLSGSNTGDQTTITGNAGTATRLQTARTINGVAFDGSANITISAVDSTSRIASSEKGAANGVATLDGTGKIPSSQLPSYVDDVLEFATFGEFPVNGTSGILYVAIDTNKAYRWSGSTYIYITSGAVDSVAGKTGVVTLVKVDVGLGNVDNTSDTDKPVSIAQQTAINTAQANAVAASTPSSHVGSSGAAHAQVTTTVDGFMAASDKVKLNAITGTNTGDETAATIRSKLGVTTLSGSNTGDQTTITGNAGTATTLQTSRLINGVAFNGSADIVINAADSTARLASSLLGVANGVASLDATGKVPSAQLPSFVDDVLEYNNLASFPATGETGKIYVALDTNKTYRWSGSAYVYITSGAVDSVAGKTGVITLVKGDVGLANVDNTADAAKPVSTAQQTAINTAQNNAIAASAPIAHVGSGGTAHAQVTTTTDGFMIAADKVKLNAVTGTNTGDETTATIRSKLGITTLSGSNTGDQTAITGNAGTATTLQTARLINGISFNGSADITINAVDSTARIASSEKGAANGVATLDSTGKIPTAQLPLFVDDVLEFTNLANFPATGETGKIYVALDTNAIYRWSGSAYVGLGGASGVTSVAGKTGVVTLVKGDVGLGNVDNTADTAKPVSTAQQTAITNAQNAAIAASAPSAHVGSGGASHAQASTTVDGFMSAADKVKLNAITGTNTGDQTTITGNAGSATVLQTARLINGVAFNGSGNITINAVDSTARVASSLVGVANGVAPLGSNGKLPFENIAFTKDVITIPALSGTTLIPGDNTTPLITEGTQLCSIVLGPSSGTSQLLISGCFNVDCGTAARLMVVSCFRNSVCLGTKVMNFITIGRSQVFPFMFFDPFYGSSLNGTTGTYSLRFGVTAAATWYVNRNATVILNSTMSLNNPVFFEEIN